MFAPLTPAQCLHLGMLLLAGRCGCTSTLLIPTVMHGFPLVHQSGRGAEARDKAGVPG